MKTILKLMVLSYLCIWTTQAQMATHDATTSLAVAKNNALAAKNIAKNAEILRKAGSSLETLKKMKKRYDELKENVEVVSSYIEYGKQAINITNMLDEVQNVYGNALNYISTNSEMDNSHKEKVLFAYAKMVTDCVEITTESVDIITSGKYKMTDSERLTFLKDAENRLEKKLQVLLYMNKKLKYSVQKAKEVNKNNAILSSNTPPYKN